MVLGLGQAPGGLPIGPTATLWLDPNQILAVFGPYNLNYKGYYYQSSSTPFVTLPVTPSKCGLHLYSQWFSVDPAMNI